MSDKIEALQALLSRLIAKTRQHRAVIRPPAGQVHLALARRLMEYPRL